MTQIPSQGGSQSERAGQHQPPAQDPEGAQQEERVQQEHARQERRRAREEVSQARAELAGAQEQATAAGEQSREAGVRAGRAVKRALAETGFAFVGVGGYLADAISSLGVSFNRGFEHLAARGRAVLGAVSPQVQEAARGARAAAGQVAGEAAERLEEAVETVDEAAQDVRRRAPSARRRGREPAWPEDREPMRAYEQMTVDELRSRARAAGVERPWKMNKQQLLTALRQAIEEQRPVR